MRRDSLRIAVWLMTLLATGCFGLRNQPPASKNAPTPRMSSVSVQDDDPPPKITPPPMPEIPAKTTAASKDASTLRRLAAKAVEQERYLDSYHVRLRRRERSKSGAGETEIMMLKYRRAPLSVHMKWLGDVASGREILYVKGKYENKVHILTGRGDLFRLHTHLAFAPDSAIVRSKFRYDLQDAGINGMIARFTAALEAADKNPAAAGALSYLGRKQRSEFPAEMDAIEHNLPPGFDSLLPQGGIRNVYFDVATGLPMILQTFDRNQQEVEYYCFDRLQAPAALDDADFDPAILWPKLNPPDSK